MSSCLASCFWFGKVGCVRVDMEDHIGFFVANYCIRVSCNVVVEFCDRFCSVFCRLVLLRCNGAKSNKNCGVNGASVVE